MSDVLDRDLRDRVLARLGLAAAPAATLAGLNEAYRAWCHGVPFDNVRKRIALARGTSGPLPGGHARDFFEAWLSHGTGGTCWPSSQGLFALLASLGFDARRATASMRDMGVPNHATVFVRIDGEDWVADTAMLTNTVFRLRRGESYRVETPPRPLRIEAVEDRWRIWLEFDGRPEPFPCRILEDPVEHALYLERYEISRELSPFNTALYAQRNTRSGRVAFLGSTRIETRLDGSRTAEPLAPEPLRAALTQDIGLSKAILDDLDDATTP